MSRRLDVANALRADPDVHYNCCQCLLIPFHDLCGLTREQAAQLGENLGGGMGCGTACGAFSGPLMVLGLAGAGPEAADAFREAFHRENGPHACAEQMYTAHRLEMEQKERCDSVIDRSIAILEEILAHSHPVSNAGVREE